MSRIVLDLNSPHFLDDFLELEPTEMTRVAAALKKLRQLDWAQLEKHRGFHWEQIKQIRANDGRPVHSLRLTKKYRALALREEGFLRLLSLHLDHDSAYKPH